MKREEIIKRTFQIIELAKKNFTAAEISKTLNVKYARVLTILKSNGIKAAKHSHILHSELSQKIINELKKGTKQSDIARMFEVSRQYVSQVKQKYDNMNRLKN